VSQLDFRNSDTSADADQLLEALFFGKMYKPAY